MADVGAAPAEAGDARDNLMDLVFGQSTAEDGAAAEDGPAEPGGAEPEPGPTSSHESDGAEAEGAGEAAEAVASEEERAEGSGNGVSAAEDAPRSAVEGAGEASAGSGGDPGREDPESVAQELISAAKEAEGLSASEPAAEAEPAGELGEEPSAPDAPGAQEAAEEPASEPDAGGASEAARTSKQSSADAPEANGDAHHTHTVAVEPETPRGRGKSRDAKWTSYFDEEDSSQSPGPTPRPQSARPADAMRDPHSPGGPHTVPHKGRARPMTAAPGGSMYTTYPGYERFVPPPPKRLSMAEQEAMVARLYRVKPSHPPGGRRPRSAMVRYKRDANTGQFQRTLVPMPRKTVEERTASMVQLYERCCEREAKVQAQLRDKYLQPLCAPKVYEGPAAKQTLRTKTERLYMGQRAMEDTDPEWEDTVARLRRKLKM
ncbi:unnamed protein product [Pedinophyceae sp. YPF-701]|nr:unnamed protein product [Pedinophyceae sp. YPF-701]